MANSALRILLLESNPQDAEEIQAALMSGGIEAEWLRVDSRDGFVPALADETLHLILSAYTLTDFNGLSALAIAQHQRPDIPFILISNTLGEDLAIEVLKQGATDYVSKKRIQRLAPVVHRALREADERRKRHRAEQIVREREAHLRLILESAKDYAIFTLDMTGHITSWNAGAQRLLGYEEAEILHRDWRLIFTSEDNTARECERELEQALTQGRSENERWHIRKDGRFFWASGLVMPLRNPAGQVQGFLKIMQDKTTQRQIEENLRLSESRYRTLANAVSQLMWINDANGNVQFYNHRWQEYTGKSLQLNVGLWAEVIHPDDFQATHQVRQQAIRAGEAYEVECRLKRLDHMYRWHLARIVPLKDERNQILYWFGTATDIHDIKQVEAGQRFLAESSSVLASSLDYHTTLSNIAQLAVPFLADFCFFDVLASDGSVQRVVWHHRNPTKQAWFDQISHYIPPPEFDPHPITQVLRTGKPVYIPYVTDAWVESIAISPVHLQFMHDCQLRSHITVPLTARDQALGALTLCFTADSGRSHTLGDLALAQEVAHRAALALDNARLYRQAQEANRIKDEFLTVLSHELRSPLNPILGWTRLLRSRKFDDAATDRALATIERNAKIQTQLIDDLLDVARILRGKLALEVHPVHLATCIEAAIETVQLAADAKFIQVQFIQADGATDGETPCPYQVLGDAARLQQVVWNLLSNAVKFTPEQGRIEIRLGRVAQGHPTGGVATDSPLPDLAQITITDTGKGITPDFLPYIFDYFRQADSSTTRTFGGLGLGLAIVRHIVEQHGGTVQADSPGVDQGATFTVRLPLMPAERSLQQELILSPPLITLRPLAGVHILVVDDEADTRDLLTVVLHNAGATITPVASAQEALQVLSQVTAIDVVISDIGMPGMDGYQLIQAIRAASDQQKAIPAIAVTAYAGEFNQQKALTAGFQRHLSKPTDPDVLVTAIVSLVKEFVHPS